MVIKESNSIHINESSIQIYKIEDNKYLVNHSDAEIISENYNIDLADAYNRIAEYNEINVDDMIPVLNESDILSNPNIISLYNNFIINNTVLEDTELSNDIDYILDEAIRYQDEDVVINLLEEVEKIDPNENFNGVTIDNDDYTTKRVGNKWSYSDVVVPKKKTIIKNFAKTHRKGLIAAGAAAAIAGQGILFKKKIINKISLLNSKIRKLEYQKRINPSKAGFITRLIERIKQTIKNLTNKLSSRRN